VHRDEIRAPAFIVVGITCRAAWRSCPIPPALVEWLPDFSQVTNADNDPAFANHSPDRGRVESTP
jgi:hypothetical protein